MDNKRLTIFMGVFFILFVIVSIYFKMEIDRIYTNFGYHLMQGGNVGK